MTQTDGEISKEIKETRGADGRLQGEIEGDSKAFGGKILQNKYHRMDTWKQIEGREEREAMKQRHRTF